MITSGVRAASAKPARMDEAGRRLETGNLD